MMAAREPEVGQVYVFSLHAVAAPLQPQSSDRYGACKVIDIAPDGAVLAVLDWTGQKMPDLATIEDCPLLQIDCGPFEGEPALFWGGGALPEDVQQVGELPLTEEEVTALACTCEGALCICPRHYGGWRACRATAYRQWRHRSGQCVIFKLPQTALRRVYVPEPFIDRVLEEELLGFAFEVVWATDEVLTLCPYCLGVVHPGTAQCPSCGLEMTRDTLTRMSLEERDGLSRKLCAFCGVEIPEPADPCPYCSQGAHRHGEDTSVAIV